MSTENQTSAHPDLEALRRTEPAAGDTPRRPWLPRLTVLVLVLGLLGAAYAVLHPVLFPPRVVAVSSVRPISSKDGARRAASFVQAAGWIEAHPYPVTVRPLVKGVLGEVTVLEGSKVEKDVTVIARLHNADIENALPVAQAEVALRAAASAKAKTSLDVAASLLEQKLPLRAAVAQRGGELATARAQVDRAGARRKAGEAALEKSEVDLKAQEDLLAAGHGTPTARASAKARVNEAEERVTELRFDEVRFVADLSRIQSLLDLAREALSDPRDLQGQVDDARAEFVRAQAAHARAQADLDVAQRNVGLLTIKAPITGTVLRLESAPGALVGPQGEFKGAGEGVGSTGLLNRLTGTVCSLYDPAQLQVRVDVPYADLPGIAKGTAVEIEAKALPGRTFEGRVDRLVREADITQAKLQVKVKLIDPDPALTPEMLCTVRFVVKAGKSAGDGGPKVVGRVQVPSGALRGEAVFVYDPTGGGRARRVPVRIVRKGDTWTEVEGDLGLATKVILDDVADGESVKVQR